MYFAFPIYFQLLRLARREQNPRNRRKLLFRLLVTLPAIATFHAICFFLDPILFPGLRRTQVKTPVFIVGHARSGTTLLHRLMAEDTERFSAFMYYELFFPSLLEKKLIRFFARGKNPTFAGRVESLIETFPDARIVVPFRNPYETIPSLLKLMKVAWGMRKWSEAEMQRSLRILADQSYHTYTYPLEVLARHPETPQAVVDYTELVAEPKRVIEGVYAELDFPVTPELERMLEAEQQKAKKHEGKHAYSLEEFGLRGDEIRTKLADLFERFGWGEAGTRRAAAKDA